MAHKVIRIACASDENYAPHCAAMLHSLLSKNPPKNIIVHFLHGPRLQPEVIQGLEQVVHGLGSQFDRVEVPDEKVVGLQQRGTIAGVMWYRIYLPEYLSTVERVLYLDADTLVLDSIQPLWDTDLNGCYAAAVCNDFEPRLRHRAQMLGLKSMTDYFNSGVLLMNLELMRRDGITNKIIETARLYGSRLMWQDQDPMNMVFDGRWVSLHPRWNCQNSLFFFDHAEAVFGKESVREALSQPAILHFEGPAVLKPWHYLCKHPFRDSYYAHRKNTPWWPITLEGDTFVSRLLRPLPTNLALIALSILFRLKRKLNKLIRRRG